jgi:DNA adenine methylase
MIRALDGGQKLDNSPKPFLRWAGGKRHLTSLLIESFPNEFDPLRHKFFEPFLGGGALSFALGDTRASDSLPGRNLKVSDMNPDLVNAYIVVRDSVENLIFQLKTLEKQIDEENYYRIRADIPSDQIERAARFIYLNKTCYNGLWRVNREGFFNVPFDKTKTGKARLFSEANLIACSSRLQESSIEHDGFETAIKHATAGDLVYFDPPYIPVTPTASFSAYSKEGFGENDHRRLAEVIKELTERGVYVLFSNSDTPLTRKIFRNHLTLRHKDMRRSMSADGSNRKNVLEVIGMNYSHTQSSKMSSLKLISHPKDRSLLL